nr:OAM dimerization domain-containing protein [Desulfotomaculum copahuensis]
MDPTRVKPYGDTLDDGAVQLSFTLPVPCGDEAKEAARRLAGKMGLEEAVVVYAQELGGGFTFLVVYGRCVHAVDFTAIKVPKVDVKVMSKDAVDRFIQEKFGRKICIIGACIESDAHTVGIDAIMNMKGYNGHKGLEAYHEIEALNLGAQVPCEELVALAIERRADAILVSQVVTQKNIHLRNLTKLMDMLEAENLRLSTLAVIGGPRITQELAQELGFDAGFGPGTYADDVASYVVQEMARRRGVIADV